MARLTDSQYLSWEEVYCAITALDGYHSHSDNIHYIWSVTLIYALPPSMDHDHHFHLQHSSHPPFASGRHLLMPEPSHLSHIIGSFVTGTSIISAHQEARPWNVVETETMEILNGDKVPLGDNKGATDGNSI